MAVLGPTASGKSALGLALARRLGGEILCCDSMQVYRGMDIGTAKPTASDRAEVPHHLLDLVTPGESFHAAAWSERARVVIHEVRSRGRLPIIVGGTGLYFRALVDGLFEAPPSDPAIRARHQAEGAEALYLRLQAIDPDAARRTRPADLVRISRALEVYEQTGVPLTELQRRAPRPDPLRLFVIVLDPLLSELRPRIDARVDQMMAAGFLDEVRGLRAAGHARFEALGYGPLCAHIDGQFTLAQAVDETRRTTHAYARRQRTWFRKQPAATRLAAAPDPESLASQIARWCTIARHPHG